MHPVRSISMVAFREDYPSRHDSSIRARVPHEDDEYAESAMRAVSEGEQGM